MTQKPTVFRPLDNKAVRGNVPDNILKAHARTVQLQNQNIGADSSEEVSGNTGVTVVDLLLAPDDSSTVFNDPTDPGYTGTFTSKGTPFNGIKYGVGTVLNGVLQAGFGLLGEFYVAAGAVIGNALGWTMVGLNYLLNWVATNAGVTRYGNIGMFLPSVGTVSTPAYGWNYYATGGTNVVPDDTLGNWTDAQSVWATGAVSQWGINNSFYHAPTMGTPGLLTRTVAGVSPSTNYIFSFAEKLTQGAFAPYLTIQERDSGHSNVGSLVTINGAINSTWQWYLQSWITQSTTAEIVITLYPGWNFNAAYFDAISFAPASVSWTEWLTDYGKFSTAPQVLNEQLSAPATPPAYYETVAGEINRKRISITNASGYKSFVPEAGWLPNAFQMNYPMNAAASTGLTLPANGGCAAAPYLLGAPMLLQSVSIWQASTSTQRTWNWALYEQYTNTGSSSENALTRIAVGTSADTFTPGAASLRTIDAAGAPVYLPPGLYWLVIQNQHASNTFVTPTAGYGGAMTPVDTLMTKTITNPFGTTLDFVAASWTKPQNTQFLQAVLNGRVFGQTTAY